MPCEVMDGGVYIGLSKGYFLSKSDWMEPIEESTDEAS